MRTTKGAWSTSTCGVLLSDLVGHLPHEQRYVVVERFVEQKSIREIARELQGTEGAVKQLQLRALQNLRARMRAF